MENRLKSSDHGDRGAVLEASLRLEEEQQRAQGLTSINNLLREQLEQAGETITTQKLDVQRLQQECFRLRDELDNREQQFTAETRHFNDYLADEHNRLLTLWRAIVTLRRQFNEVKLATERDLAFARSDMTKFMRNIHTACLNFTGNLRSVDTQAQVTFNRLYLQTFALQLPYFFKPKN